MSHIGLMGGIGAGKTTLCAAATAQGYHSFEEYVNDTFLGDYIGDGPAHAFDFQMSMMHGSVGRMRYGTRRKRALIERPMPENVVFEHANHATGHITPAQHQRYTLYVADYARKEPACTAHVYLHAHEDVLWQRKMGRARPGEDKYNEKGDHYWERLADSYLLAFVEHALRDQGRPVGLPPSPWKLSTPRVLYWEPFGTFDAVLRALELPPPVVDPALTRAPYSFSLADYRQWPFYSAQAVAARDTFFRSVARDQAVRVELGEHKDLLCFY